jgi:hypothetical protein
LDLKISQSKESSKPWELTKNEFPGLELEALEGLEVKPDSGLSFAIVSNRAGTMQVDSP